MTKDAESKEEQAEPTRDHPSTDTTTSPATEPELRTLGTGTHLIGSSTPTEGPATSGEEATEAASEAGEGQPRRNILLDRVMDRHKGLTEDMLKGASDELLWFLHDQSELPASVPPPAKGAAPKDFRPKPGTVKFKRYSERK